MSKAVTMKVTVEFEIRAVPGNSDDINAEIRDMLSDLVDDESPSDREGVSVQEPDEEDEG